MKPQSNINAHILHLITSLIWMSNFMMFEYIVNVFYHNAFYLWCYFIYRMLELIPLFLHMCCIQCSCNVTPLQNQLVGISSGVVSWFSGVPDSDGPDWCWGLEGGDPDQGQRCRGRLQIPEPHPRALSCKTKLCRYFMTVYKSAKQFIYF